MEGYSFHKWLRTFWGVLHWNVRHINCIEVLF